MPDAPRLSIVIVTYNATADVERCLASLAAARLAVSHEILVVDNASREDVVGVVRTAHPGATAIALPVNVGFSKANNVGIRQARGELVLLLNPDTIVGAGALEVLVAELDRDGQIGVVGPRLVGTDGTIELSFGRALSPLSEWRQKRRGRALARRDPRAVAWLAQATSRRHDPDWVSGACLMTRRSVADAVGLLDERYFLYTEDVDFCASVRERGWRVVFTPDAEVVHVGGRSGATAPSATAAFYRRSQVAYYEKRQPLWAGVLKLYLRLKGAWPPAAEPR